MRRWCLAAATLAAVLGVSTSEAVAAGAPTSWRCTPPPSRAAARCAGQRDRPVRPRPAPEGRVDRAHPHRPSSARSSPPTGVATKLTRVKGGKTVKQFAAAQAADGFNVWRSWDEPGGYPRPDVRASRASNPRHRQARAASARRSRAARSSRSSSPTSARDVRDGSRPAVLYSSTQHAREWIATEVNRRLMNYVHRRLARRRQADQEAAAGHRAVVRARREPGRLPVHVRRRAPVAQEPARQRRRRPDHGRRRRRPQPQLPQPLELRQGGLVVDPLERHLPRAAAGSEPETQAHEGPARPDRLRVPGQLALRRPVAALRRGLADRARRPRTTRSTTRCRATSTSRRSRASTRA